MTALLQNDMEVKRMAEQIIPGPGGRVPKMSIFGWSMENLVVYQLMNLE